jgi:hypothetical protein
MMCKERGKGGKKLVMVAVIMGKGRRKRATEIEPGTAEVPLRKEGKRKGKKILFTKVEQLTCSHSGGTTRSTWRE